MLPAFSMHFQRVFDSYKNASGSVGVLYHNLKTFLKIRKCASFQERLFIGFKSQEAIGALKPTYL